MPKENLSSPTATPQSLAFTIANVPAGTCSGLVVLSNIGTSGKIYLKYAAGADDPVSSTDYEDFIDVGDQRFLDNLEAGAIRGFCAVAQNAANLVRHNSWKNA